MIDIPSDVHIMLAPCLGHYVVSNVHSVGQKTEQILACFFTASTITLPLRPVAMVMDVRIQNGGYHVESACGTLFIRAMLAVGGTHAHMGMHVPPADVM
jgi:hypothetical protein